MLMSGVTSLSLQQVNEQWNLFKDRFSRTYTSPEEEISRYTVFTENLKTIFLHNMAADKGHYSYWLGINAFADLTNKEFEEQYTGLKITPRGRKVDEKLLRYNLSSLPKETDWRDEKCVTHVKFQGGCGDSYAFSATGALEGHRCIRTGKLVSLSEQNILDCTYNNTSRDEGCAGGDPNNAFQYVMDNGGIDTEESYPYKAKVGKCEFSKKDVGAIEKGFYDIPEGNEIVLQAAVAWIGPVSACAYSPGFRFYQHGVYDCGNKSDSSIMVSNLPKHAMLVVGFDQTVEGEDYWILKNSWGTSWGIRGYMRLARNKRNTCGIASYASYPVV
ncbi:procathepsin L-like [Mercenaria mercenaria]|uniref:procathepsin L-like n=1 Tax=Mercenaria mercenaria TaxID=6596 RepID=UPI00234E48A0|nr:procathepsin L-like [Mercenaria mercenaria]